jgi:hypothetical protein
MKPLCFALLLALSIPGCSRFTASGRMDRAYYKQLKQVKKDREKHRKNLMAHQRAATPGLRDNAPPPLEMQSVQSTSESQ